MTPAYRLRALALSLCTVASSCKVGPDYETPKANLDANWSGMPARSIAGVPEDPTAWWKQMHDALLTELVAEGLAQNLPLQAAGLRVIQARARRAASWWLLSPIPALSGGWTHVDLSQTVKPDVEVAGGSISVTPPAFPIPAGLKPTITVDELPSVSVSDEVDRYDVGLAALWEPDIWGRDRRRIEAAGATLDATVASRDDVAVLTAAEIALAYVQIRTADKRIESQRRLIELIERAVAAAEKRIGIGAQGQADVQLALARTLLLDAQAKLPLFETGREFAINALAVVLGKLPSEVRTRLAPGTDIPAAPGVIALGAPADLLRRRPDVRMAERLAAAQCARVGVAKSHLYPSLDLFGSIGYAASHSTDLFDSASETHAYGFGLSWNILLYPVLVEAIRTEDAQFQEAILAYQEKVLQAGREVEDGLVMWRKSEEREGLLAKSVEESRKAAKFALDLYVDGNGDFSDLFDALHGALQQEDQAILARGAIAQAVIHTYKALGGGWEVTVGQPMIGDDTRKQMQDRSEWSSFGGEGRLEGVR